MNEYCPIQLVEPQEVYDFVTPDMSVPETGQVPEKIHPVISLGACGVTSQGGGWSCGCNLEAIT